LIESQQDSSPTALTLLANREGANPPADEANLIGGLGSELAREYTTREAKESVALSSVSLVTEALLLVPAQIDTAWFLALAEHPRAFLRQRPVFAVAADSAAAESQQPYAVVFLGQAERIEAFAAAFADLADTYQPIPAGIAPLATN
jgi:hypothetical protein